MLEWNHVWLASYQRPMESAVAILEWVRGAGLNASVERLSLEPQASYLAECKSGRKA